VGFVLTGGLGFNPLTTYLFEFSVITLPVLAGSEVVAVLLLLFKDIVFDPPPFRFIIFFGY